MKTTRTLFLCAILVACGDNTQTADGGDDATTPDVVSEGSAKDVATEAATDAKADVAIDAPTEAATDAGIDVIADAIADAAPETSTGCDGGCTKFSVECSSAKPVCQCLGLANGQTGPVCDAAPANCFVDPCSTKSVQCINDTCVIQ